MATLATLPAVVTLQLQRTKPFPSRSFSSSSLYFNPLLTVRKKLRAASHLLVAKGTVENDSKQDSEDEELSDFKVLVNFRSQYNDIIVVDTPKSRLLLLDQSRNIHSMINKDQKWTGSYWDEFVALPAVIPQGPVAILGLGAGTAAHVMLELWPSLHLEGWEIDELLIDIAREYFCLSNLEKLTEAGGVLKVHIGDALSPFSTIKGGFAGIIVDLFADGKVLQQLGEVDTWLEMKKKLMPNGRIMVNCGGAHAEMSNDGATNVLPQSNGSWVKNSAIRALCRAFPGNLSWKRMAEEESENYLALTGQFPDMDAWSAALPHPLSITVKDWRPCELD